MVVRRTSEAVPLLVTDQRGKVVHATSALAQLLGYSKAQLVTMELTDLLPPPYAQLHKAWVQVRTTRPCRQLGALTGCRRQQLTMLGRLTRTSLR
jgi:PAS domain S-box-containing protein